MEAERDTIDRYVAAFLAERVGEEVDARITGVASFGLFATVEGIGGNGLMPARDLGRESFSASTRRRQRLVGEESGDAFTLGQRLRLRLADANPVSGALRFELPAATHRDPPGRAPPRVLKRRGRPANIRHQGERR